MNDSIQLGKALGQLFRTNKHIPAKIRFWASIEIIETGCWEWLGTKQKPSDKRYGYGFFYIKGKNIKVIRWAYEYLIGPIPDGLELDHLCRNHSCVNPWHTEPVTHIVNVQRGGAKKGVCIRGHRLESPNLVYDGIRNGLKRFRCRECVNIKGKLRYSKKENYIARLERVELNS